MTTEVLIIGAGISGLEAARLLRQNGIKTMILEARNRTGGRIWSVPSKTGHMLDLGAAWIHGIRGSIPSGLLTNPLWDLIQEAKIHTRGTEAKDIHVFYPANDSISDIGSWFDEYMDFVRENARISSTNVSFGYYANIFSEKKNFTEKQRYAFYSYLHNAIESNEATELDTISAKGFLDVTSVHYGEEHIFYETGFMALTNYLAKDIEDIRFEQVVTKINYYEELVEVSTRDGQVYRAEFVLITVPLGVLKSEQINFSPQLPSWKLNAIHRLGFGIFEKVILLWDQAWWNSTNFYFMRISSEPADFGYWVNVNKWNDQPAIICFFSGQAAFRLKLNDNQDEIVEKVRQTLQQMFPDIVVPVPVDSYVTHWNQDPFSYGSYSYVSVNQKYEDPSYLAEPIGNRLLFAGEATSTDSYGYAHGALLSARREVTRLLFIYDLYRNRTQSFSKP
jgi:monoamine oxidase